MLENDWEVLSGLVKEFEAFTCAIYGIPRFASVDDLRVHMIRVKCDGDDGKIDPSRNVDFSSIPPCKKSLDEHIRCVNYPVCIWKLLMGLFTQSNPNPEGHGWTIDCPSMSLGFKFK